MALVSWHPRPYSVDEARNDRGYARHFTYGWVTENVQSFTRLAEIVTSKVWSPLVFREGYRKTEQFQGARWLALDFDSPEYPLAQALNEWCDTTHLIGTTKNHQRTKGDKPPCDRFRLIVPFDRTITSIDEYVYNVETLIDAYDADSQAKDPARLFFPCVHIVSTVTDGELQPVRAVPDDYVTPTQKAARFAQNLSRYQKAHVVPRWVRAKLETEIPEGVRNNTIYGLAKDLTNLGFSAPKILELILASKTYAGKTLSLRLSEEIQNAVANGSTAGGAHV